MRILPHILYIIFAVAYARIHKNMSGRQTISRKLEWSNAAGPLLIVDDDVDEAKLTKRAIERLQPTCPVRTVHLGEELLAYLEGQGTYSDREAHPLPSLILLDLKMPGMDGFAILEWIKREAKYAHVPIVVVSGVEDFEQMKRAYALNARSYLFKPLNVESFCHILSSLRIAV
jgi:CheY-like chemotaxis protein